MVKGATTKECIQMKAILSPDLLVRVTARVLEESAFLFVDVADDPPPFEGELLEAQLDFSGSQSGTLMLSATSDFGQHLAANLLGIEPDELASQAHGSDALSEMLNILSGAVLEAFLGSTDICQCSVPRIVSVSPTEHDQHQKRAAQCVSLISDEGYRIDAAIDLKE